MTVACCDTCGKPYVENTLLYSLATKHDEAGNLVSFRHWDCNETNGPFAQLRRGLADLGKGASDFIDDINKAVKK